MSRKVRHRLQQKHFKNLMFRTTCLLNESFLTDFKLVCDNKEYLVHRIVLSAASPFFEQYFKNNPDVKTHYIYYMESETLENVLKFIYTGRIDLAKKNESFLKDLVEAFRKFKMPLMCNYCLHFLLDTHFPEQFLSQWNKVDGMKSNSVKKTYLEYLQSNIDCLKTTKSFLNLNFEQLDSVLSCSTSNVNNKEEMTDAVLLWIKHDFLKRKDKITNLLKKIDISKLNDSYLVTLKDEPLLKDNSYLNEQCANKLCQQIKRKKCSTFSKTLSQPLGNTKLEQPKLLIEDNVSTDRTLKFSKGPPVSSIKVDTNFNLSVTSFENTKENLPTENMETKSSSSLNQKKLSKKNKTSQKRIDVKVQQKGRDQRDDSLKQNTNKVKGYQEKFSNSHKRTERHRTLSKRILCCDSYSWKEIIEYDYETEALIEIKDEVLLNIFKKAKRSAVWSSGNIVYFFGGENKGNSINDCYSVDLIKHKSISLKPMKHSCFDSTAIQLHDFIYIIGGRLTRGHEICVRNSNERYNIKANLWEEVSEIKYPHSVCAPVTAIGDRLCLVGYEHLIWYYPETNQWKKEQVLPKKSLSLEAVAYDNGKLFILGGNPANVLTYDLNDLSWDTHQIPVHLHRISDILKLPKSETLRFIVVCQNKFFLFQLPSSWKLVSSIPMGFPTLISIPN